jgi:hypothetical protein
MPAVIRKYLYPLNLFLVIQFAVLLSAHGQQWSGPVRITGQFILNGYPDLAVHNLLLLSGNFCPGDCLDKKLIYQV